VFRVEGLIPEVHEPSLTVGLGFDSKLAVIGVVSYRFRV
jgi:hypothetical protein